MMKLLVLAALVAAVAAERATYRGYKVFEIILESKEQLNLLSGLPYADKLDYWSTPHGLGKPFSIMVPPFALPHFRLSLRSFRIKNKILIEDVETVFEQERLAQERAPKVEKGRISFTQYHRLDVILDYVYQLAEDYPDVVSIEIVGSSVEDRPIVMLKIGTGEPNKPILYFNSGIHAREWISPPVALYIIQQLVENPEFRYLLDATDFYIIPVLNPDGYEFSHTNIRMWRKNRRIGTICNGVDLNRNFDHQWNTVGTSPDQCSEVYPGLAPNSEPETRAFIEVINRYGSNIRAHLDIHSFGQYLLYPWGYTPTLPPNAAELQALGDDMDRAIQSVYGTAYLVGPSGATLYSTSGTTVDWTYANGVNITYTVELPGGGVTGFDLPPERIDPVIRETWEAILVLQKYVADRFA